MTTGLTYFLLLTLCPVVAKDHFTGQLKPEAENGFW